MPYEPTGNGSQSYEIRNSAFVMGMSTSDNTDDGGFSSLTAQVNLISNPGVVRPTAPTTVKDNTSSNIPIASSDDPNFLGNPGGNSKYILKKDRSTQTGIFCNVDINNNVTESKTDTANYYAYAVSDMVAYNAAGTVGVFTTTNGKVSDNTKADITYWDGNSTLTPNWWTTVATVSGGGHPSALKIGCPHPLLVFSANTMLYVADKNLLHKYDGTTVVQAVLTLSSEQTITALGIDPSSGYMMVGVSTRANFPDLASTSSYIGLYDGTNPTQFTKVIPVDDQISAFYNVGGTIFVFYGQNMGYFTGSGIKFLRKIANIDYVSGLLTYKPHVTNISNTLYVVAGSTLMAFGETISGSNSNYGVGNKVFYNALDYDDSTPILFITNVGAGNLMVYRAAGDASISSIEIFNVYGDSTDSSNLTFYSNRTYHARPISVRSVGVEIDQVKSGAGTMTLYLMDDNGNTNTIGSMPDGVKHWRFLCNIADQLTASQIKVVSTNNISGVVRIVVYYDFAE
jgi:hypothetical protein